MQEKFIARIGASLKKITLDQSTPIFPVTLVATNPPNYRLLFPYLCCYVDQLAATNTKVFTKQTLAVAK